MGVLEREAEAIAAHRASLRGAALAPPRGLTPAPTFAHGFLLPFTLVVATLRDARLRSRYLRATIVRTAIVLVVGGFAIANGAIDAELHHPKDWLLEVVALLAVLEGIITFFSRRWDDHLGFDASALARIRPEQTTPPAPPKVAADFKWLYRKARRRVRGYVVFAAGVPLLYPVQLLPTVGDWIFTLLLTLWGWYWLGVFSAAKTAHAWVDERVAPPPLAIRTLNERVANGALLWPIRVYGQAWASVTRGLFPAAAVFERAPRAFLGLALARALLSLPGFYFLARPIIPVAAGRLVAESDPWDRFSAT